MDVKQLLAGMDLLKQQMIAVSTGGPRIADVNDEYKERWTEVNDALSSRGVENPNPHHDLWNWYGKWSSGDLPNYQSRRRYVALLYDSLERTLRASTSIPNRPVPLTGWPRVDREINKARDQLATATEAEDFQRVGLLCREALISLAQSVYTPARHPPIDDKTPSDTDAKRMLGAYIAKELEGGSNDEARAHAKGALSLANALQHRRTATFRDAAMCAEATTSVINLIAIVAGRHGASASSPAPQPTSRQADRSLFAQFKEALPSQGSIAFLSQHNMAFSFRRESLDELYDFDYLWTDAEHEFFEPELEKSRKQLRRVLGDFLANVTTNTWAIDDILQGIPQDWKEKNPKRYLDVVASLNDSAQRVVEAHQAVVRAGRRLLGN
jgi:hypothetical protein